MINFLYAASFGNVLQQIDDVEVTCVRIKSCLVSDDGRPDPPSTLNQVDNTLSYAFGQWWSVKFAASTASGDIFIVNGLRTPPPSTTKRGEIEFTDTPVILSKMHHCRISCLEWNMMGTKLFSGKLGNKLPNQLGQYGHSNETSFPSTFHVLFAY